MTPQLSVIVATRNRERSLRSMLATLDLALRQRAIAVEVLLVDNGSSDATAALLARWCRQHPGSKALNAPRAGKARALNVALAAAAAPLLAFTDDDVEVPADWIEQIVSFCDAHREYSAVTGRIGLPPQTDNPRLLAQVELYRTLPLFDAGPAVHDTKHLYGCNMAVRSAVLRSLGGFDERLGPGASGLHEDGDLARRLRAAGHRIAYNPHMQMWHTADATRLTEEFFRYLHCADARSRFVQPGNRGLGYAVRHWLGAAIMYTLWRFAGSRPRAMRARGRLLSHREYLRLVQEARAARK